MYRRKEGGRRPEQEVSEEQADTQLHGELFKPLGSMGVANSTPGTMATEGCAQVSPWGELPDDVVSKIQGRLPLASLFRSRAVCKAWSRSVKSRWFLEERWHSRGGEPESLLYLADQHNTSCAYDPVSDRWYQLDLPPWLRAQARGYYLQRRLKAAAGTDTGTGTGDQAPSDTTSASAGGGVLLDVAHPDSRLLLGNPVRGCWTHLPAFPSPTLRMQHVRGLLVERGDGGFKVVAVAEQAQGVMPTFVLDSKTWRWSLTACAGPVAAEAVDPLVSSGHGAFVGRVLYCLTVRCNLLAYDLDTAKWAWVKVDKPGVLGSSNVLDGHVVAVRDRQVVCVGVVQEPVHWRLHVWVMDWASRSWVRARTMPGRMFDAFLGRESGRRVAMRYLRLSVASIGDEVYIMSRDVPGGVACNVAGTETASWRWLPRCPYYDDSGDEAHSSRKGMHCLDPWLHFDSSRAS